ncbi:UvrB domain 3-containing protein [Cereibacter johrii]|uniref:type I restriction enzyme subunit R domain-containing protein n=1 Tax=Cereibacter johrii TaxID=445629 RepID=UPI001F2C42B7|nr:hypothetical protein [Cereibacter johrii]
MQSYITEKGYALGTLVAFSGEVTDPESGPDPFSETSKALNPGLKGDIRETFKGAGFQVLIVANKFQTGFDQPLLCGMYIDRRLAGIQAVQTLSRLNRAYQSGGVVKDTTYVLDFANSADDILTAFKIYYETAELQDVTDPNQVLDLRAKLDGLVELFLVVVRGLLGEGRVLQELALYRHRIGELVVVGEVAGEANLRWIGFSAISHEPVSAPNGLRQRSGRRA